MKYILFISHDASRTGAPILLLHFLKWFSKHGGNPFVVLLRQDGVLREEFEKLSPVILCRPSPTFKPTLINKIKSRLSKIGGKGRDTTKHLLAPYDIGLVFSNTFTNGKLLMDIAYLDVPVISYIHELKYSLSTDYAGPYLEYTVSQTNFFLAGSRAVRRNLTESYSIPTDKSMVMYSFLPSSFFVRDSSPSDGQALRQFMGIKPGSLVIGGIGTGVWRKGIDLFLVLAKELASRKPHFPCHFIWVGVDASRHGGQELTYDIERAGLSGRVHLVSNTPDYADYLRLFDIFVLTSREDPYPLVMLEAALLEKPIVCFDGAGGTPEFVQADAGIAVPYLDVRSMADAVCRLKDQPEERRKMTDIAKNRMTQMHDIEVAAPQIVKVIAEYMKS